MADHGHPAIAGNQPKWATLAEMCRDRAAQEPGRRSFVFLDGGAGQGDSLTLSELHQRAMAIAVQLTRLAPEGTRALLNYAPGLDFIPAFFGCLYAGMVAVPIAPVETGRVDVKRSRLRAIMASAQPELFLTTSDLLEHARTVREADGLPTLTDLATDQVPGDLAGQWRAPDAGPESAAYLQYSSGSTGAPKGVILTNRNVMSNLALIHHNGATEGDVDLPPAVLWLPLFHDMGLVNSVLQPLYAGYDAVLMSPLSFVQRPVTWLEAISRLDRAISVAPNFAYELCVKRVKPEQRAKLDLSGWSLAAVGAEPVRAQTLDQFCEMFGPCGFRPSAIFPCYGLAESTVMVSGGPPEIPPVIRDFDADALAAGKVGIARPGGGRSRRLVGCGQIQPTMTVVIVDPTGLPCGPDEVGEIYVAGDSVGRGYWRAPEETERTFRARLPGYGSQDFLRSGDLGFLREAQLFITGRAKDVIILDGLNYYPHDVETTASASHPALRQGFCCAFSVDDGERERLVVLIEVGRKYRVTRGPAADPADGDRPAVDVSEVERAVRRSVTAEYGIHVDDLMLLRMGSLLFTSSAKIQRLESRALYQSGGFDGKRVA